MKLVDDPWPVSVFIVFIRDLFSQGYNPTLTTFEPVYVSSNIPRGAMKHLLTSLLLLTIMSVLYCPVYGLPREKRQNWIYEYDKDTIVFNDGDDNDSCEWWLKLITSTTTTTTTTNRPSTSTNPEDDRLCENNCLSTPEYNPICATDGVGYQTYQNPSRFRCARKCGLDIEIHHFGRCSFRSS